MPGDGGVCGVVLEVLLDEAELDVADFAVVVVAGVVALAVIFVGAAGVEVVAEGAEVFVELVVVAVFDPVVVEVPEVPPVDLFDFDFEFFLFEVDELFEVDVLDEVEELEDPVGACDLRSVEETTAIKNASKTGGTTLL